MSRRLIAGVVALLSSLLAAGYGAVAVLSAPDPYHIGAAPPDLPARAVSIPRASGAELEGGFVRGKPQSGAVLLLHGVHANRLAMLGRARFVSAAGYAAYAKAEYERRVLAFLASSLRRADAQATARSIPSAATSTMKSISSGVMQYGGMK